MPPTLPHLAQDQPSRWVSRFAGLIPQGLVLDLACGGGRHARFLARLGHQVLAVDRDERALAASAGTGITALRFDLEAIDAPGHPEWPFATSRFVGAVVTNYLHRPLFVPLLSSVAEGGVLIYETFAVGNGHFGKPSNPDFLLAHGELLDVLQSAAGWRVLAFEDGFTTDPGPAMVQRICAVKAGAAGVSVGHADPLQSWF